MRGRSNRKFRISSRRSREKQYEIITKPEQESFVLQGCAGSGKTMIMLHRLSFLMYNNENLRPSDVLVLTPSESFNAFIDELSQVLELEKVKTQQIDEYFLLLLKNEGIDIGGKIDAAAGVPQKYLEYIYSEKFYKDVQSRLGKIYGGHTGYVPERRVRGFYRRGSGKLPQQLELFNAIKNASVRVRRSVLGEIKEKTEGGLYYTKPFRELMNEVTAAEEFFSGDLKNEKIKITAFFITGCCPFTGRGRLLCGRTARSRRMRSAILRVCGRSLRKR